MDYFHDPHQDRDLVSERWSLSPRQHGSALGGSRRAAREARGQPEPGTDEPLRDQDSRNRLRVRPREREPGGAIRESASNALSHREGPRSAPSNRIRVVRRADRRDVSDSGSEVSDADVSADSTRRESGCAQSKWNG